MMLRLSSYWNLVSSQYETNVEFSIAKIVVNLLFHECWWLCVVFLSLCLIENPTMKTCGVEM
jgi:hypothetical protein